MKQFIKTICIFTIIAGFVIGGPRHRSKSEIRTDAMKRVEPDYRNGPGASSRANCAHATPNNPNTYTTVIDSSTNGYGMVATVTRPMDVNSDGNMLTVYRQYAGENTTHGQLGAGYGVVGDGTISWNAQYNVNYNGNPPWGGGGVGGCGCAQARYPSGIASEEYPYAIWNEYTSGPPTCPAWPGECSSYGGRPYFSYDEFGWGGESWLYPAELDPLYECEKDLWSGSVGYGYDEIFDEHHVSAVYDDWTRTGHYLFTSEAVEDGYIVLGTETLIINPQHLGTDGYSSRSILSMNNNGQGLLGLDGIFAGNDMDAGTCSPPASNLTCNKTPMFKLTNDFGQSWAGNHAAFDLYYVPDAVFNDIYTSWPSTVISDPCTGLAEDIIGFWSWYEFDMRIDNDGNPHIVISMVAETNSAFVFIDGKTGFYHMTIDKDNLASPGPINSATGWNWSYIPLPANNSFEWSRPDGYSYMYGAMCQISISRESAGDANDVIYMVANIAEQGEMSSTFDSDGDGVEDDPCIYQDWPQDLYPNWSEDIWVAKSEDNGTTWTALSNLTQTPRDPSNTGENNCAPEEQYVHSAHWSDDERVYFQYDQPNWEFNEIGDPLGADCMNYVWLGYSYVETTGAGGCMDPTVCNYCSDCGFDNGTCANVIGTQLCSNGLSGCDCNDECYDDATELLAVIGCDDLCGSGMTDICDTAIGGFGDCVAASDVCTEGEADGCDDSDGDGDPTGDDCTETCNEQELSPEGEVNSWTDCLSVPCGTTDPLFTCDGMITCDGGRCFTCSNPSYTDQDGCAGAGQQWQVSTVGGCDENENYGCLDVYASGNPADCPTYNATCDDLGGPNDCLEDGWVPFSNDNDDADGEESPGDPNECKCSAQGAAQDCNEACGAALGNLNGDTATGTSTPIFNVLDIVQLANCVLGGNCTDLEFGCAGDVNGDGNYNVLDIVQLANCVLAQNCGGRIDDANHSRLIIQDNVVLIEADGFIGGVEMALSHSSDFSIEMTDLADPGTGYLTSGNETRLLVITPKTDELFTFRGDFEITEIIVANSQDEVSVDLPLAVSFSLSDAYPNPFNPTTTMTLTMPVSGEMKVEVYNLLGQVVATLASGYMDANTYTLTWDATDSASGMYVVKAHADGFSTTQKLMLVK